MLPFYSNLDVGDLSGVERSASLRGLAKSSARETPSLTESQYAVSNAIVKRHLDWVSLNCSFLVNDVLAAFHLHAMVMAYLFKAGLACRHAWLAAYETGETYLMWKSVLPPSLSFELGQQDLKMRSVKTLAEEGSRECDRIFIFLSEFEPVLSDELC